MNTEASIVEHKSPGAEAFVTYLDQEIGASQVWLMLLGGFCGFSLIFAFAHMAKLAKVSHALTIDGFSITALLISLAAGLGVLALRNRGRKLSPVERQARRILIKMHSAKCSSGIKVGITVGRGSRARIQNTGGDYDTYVLSGEALAVLNEAARHTIEARSALDSAAWLNSTGPRAQVRDQTRQAIDEGMSRVVVLATSVGDTAEVRRLIDDLAAVSAEVCASAQKMNSFSAQAGEGSIGLRASLEQLREISKAEDEILSQRIEL